MGLLRGLERFGRVFERLPGMLLACDVIFLAVMRGGDAMGVRGQFVKFSGSLV
jgi:hypothetical protein